MAVEFQLHGEQTSDIFKFQRHRETLEDPKLALVLWGLCFKMEKRCALGKTVKLSPGILRGWAM